MQGILERGNMKRIAVSGKRQITIPVDYFNRLGFEQEVDCSIQDGALVIRAAKPADNGEFAEEILADLIAQGVQGEALLVAFRKMSRAIRPAVEAMIAEGEAAARGEIPCATMEVVFGREAQ